MTKTEKLSAICGKAELIEDLIKGEDEADHFDREPHDTGEGDDYHKSPSEGSLSSKRSLLPSWKQY